LKLTTEIPALLPDGTIGIVALAGPIDREAFDRGCARLREMGYRVVWDESIFSRDGYFAGSLERRVREFHEMWARPDVNAVMCARGGYGCNYLLPHLDLESILRTPKIFIGYSDVTLLQTYLNDVIGLVSFQGPMLTGDFAKPDAVHEPSWLSALQGTSPWTLESGDQTGMRPLVSGHATGKLYGGCLSILVTTLGTPYEIRTDGTILLLEDLGEPPYRIDRMLRHLKLAGKLDGVRGIVFGEMPDCETPHQQYTLERVVSRIVGDLGVPVAYGLRFGHTTRQNITLPIGVQAELEVTSDTARLTIIEAAVQTAQSTSSIANS
jgi:muramoyltetrapeptide carboxypeptidase